VQKLTLDEAVASDIYLRIVLGDVMKICTEEGVSALQNCVPMLRVQGRSLFVQLSKDQQVQWAHLVREPFSVEEGLMQPLVEDPTKFFLDRKVGTLCILGPVSFLSSCCFHCNVVPTGHRLEVC
jgi:hypothetical protein